MAVIEDVSHATGHGLGAAKDVVSKPFEAFSHTSQKTKLMIVGAVGVAVIAYWWFFLRNSAAAGLGNGSSTMAATPSGGGVSDPTQTSGGGGRTDVYIHVIPPGTGKKKPGKPKEPAKKRPKHPTHTRLHHGNGVTIPHPIPTHTQYKRARSIVTRDRGQIRELRREKQHVGRDTRREAALTRRIRKDRGVIQRNRQTVIRYRHPNKPGYLWHAPGNKRPNHPISGTRKRGRKAA